MTHQVQRKILKITSVYYERGHKNSNYGHEVIGATAGVAEDDSPEGTLASLKVWVDDHLGVSQRAAQLAQSCETLRDEEKTLQEAVSMMRLRYESARVFLEKIGLAVPTTWHDAEDLPF